MTAEAPREEDIRRQKAEQLRAKGYNPYPYAFRRSHTTAQILADFDALAAGPSSIAACGRILAVRRHGKTTFANLSDQWGKIQVYFRADALQEHYELVEQLDLGDFVGVQGKVFKTKTGEITVMADAVELLTKTLKPLPEKWHGLKDVELRYRYRYLDLVANEETRRLFQAKARVYDLIRRFLDERGFLEVETPILQPIYGGATANPFKSYYAAVDDDVYLRIADELYLKRLVVGGYEKVYEIGKDFRNEGVDRFHNPEFTMLELYEAYQDYNGMMDLVEELLAFLVHELHGSERLAYQGEELTVARPFRRLRYVDELAARLGVDPMQLDEEGLRRKGREHGLELGTDLSKGKLIDKLFGELIQNRIQEPTFVCDYPKLISPLAKEHRRDKDLVERFELVVCGVELANAFSELNDPIDQRRRFEEQLQHKEEGIGEIDEDFLTALEHGMPPTGGLGIGLDRLCMVLLDRPNLRDVILFPHLRKE